MMFSKIKFREGNFNRDCHRMLDLFKANWEETLKETFDTELDENVQYYKDLEDQKLLFSVLAVDKEDRIEGYAIGQIHGHPYIKSKRLVSISLFYLKKEHRKSMIGLSMLKYMEKLCKEKQIDYLNIGVGNNLKFKDALSLVGFEVSDITMTKRI